MNEVVGARSGWTAGWGRHLYLPHLVARFVEGGTAAIPVANVTDGTSSTLNPAVRRIEGLASFAIISAPGTVVQVAFYTKNM